MRLTTLTTVLFTSSVLALTTASAQAEPGGEIRVPQDLGTIQAAIDAASPGTVIVVSKGTYYESLFIAGASDLTIMVKRGKAVIDAAGDPTPIKITGSSHVTIRGLTTKNGLADSIKIDDSPWTTIDRCTIDASTENGIHATFSDDLIVTRCKVPRSGGTAVLAVDCDRVDVSKTKISSPYVVGIEILEQYGTSASPTISGCSITGGLHGIYVCAPGANVTNNKVKNAEGSCILLESDQAAVVGNQLTKGNTSLRVEGIGLTVTGNKASRARYYAYWIEGGDATVARNSAKQSGFGGFVLKTTNSTVENNKSSGGSGFGIHGEGNQLTSNTVKKCDVGFSVDFSMNSFLSNKSMNATFIDLTDTVGGNSYASNRFRTSWVND